MYWMLLNALFGFGQESEYEIIQKGATEYEFNKERDIVYILTEDGLLCVYYTEKKITVKLELKNYKKIEKRENALYLSETDTLFVFGKYYIYKIFENTFIEEIPFLVDERIKLSYYHKDTTYGGKEGVLNDFLKTVVDVGNINGCQIITNASGEKLAVRGFNYSLLCSKYYSKKARPLEHSINVIFAQGEHRRERKRGKNVGGEKKQTIYYGDIEIKDVIYDCSGGNGDYTQSLCKYKMKLITKDKTYILNDKIRRSRYLGKGFGKHRWTCDLFYRAPTSEYITDKNGNIYLLFDSNERVKSLNLIKL